MTELLTIACGCALIVFMTIGNALRLSLLVQFFRGWSEEEHARTVASAGLFGLSQAASDRPLIAHDRCTCPVSRAIELISDAAHEDRAQEPRCGRCRSSALHQKGITPQDDTRVNRLSREVSRNDASR